MTPLFKIVKTTLLPILLLSLLIACEREQLQKVSPQGTILAFGDSLTVGVGTTEANSYPSILAHLSGRTVVNGGVSGETTAQGVKRLPGLLDEVQPELLLVLEGGNDILRNVDPAQIKHNLATMIEQAQKLGIQVVLIAVPEKKLFSSQAEFYQELADTYHLVLIEDLIADLLRTPAYKSDAIHLNAAGYRALADKVYSVLKEHGALP